MNANASAMGTPAKTCAYVYSWETWPLSFKQVNDRLPTWEPVKELESVVLDVGGVGHEINVTAATAARLPACGEEALLLIVASYAMYGGGETLYGFSNSSEKALFCAFRDEIPGTGAKKALEYLDKASKSLPDFRRAVIDRDEKILCAVFAALFLLSFLASRRSPGA